MQILTVIHIWPKVNQWPALSPTNSQPTIGPTRVG